jgi:hypothetical protein
MLQGLHGPLDHRCAIMTHERFVSPHSAAFTAGKDDAACAWEVHLVCPI